MRRISVFLIVTLVVAFGLLRGSASAPASDAPTPQGTASTPTGTAPSPTNARATAPTTAAQRAPATSGRGFRDRAHLDEHFAKHGAEFSGLTKAQYLAMAQTLRDAPAGGNILEIIRSSDGVVSRFDKRTGAFIAFDRDGTIRTFFKPNDGEKYFRRQAKRAPVP